MDYGRQLDDLSVDVEEKVVENPSPTDFINFLPWACNQFELQIAVTIIREAAKEGSASSTRLKHKSATTQTGQKTGTYSGFAESIAVDNKNILKIKGFYQGDQLCMVKFDKLQKVPLKVIKIIALIIALYPRLTILSFQSKLTQNHLKELPDLLKTSHITELSFDGCLISDANYAVILDELARVNHLSLARCNLEDEDIKNIAEKLHFPLPASKVLHILNLSSNRITSIGANYLAQALRSNRKLNYLNVADNMIDDDGVRVILDTLKEFFLTADETIDMRHQHLDYIAHHNERQEKLRSISQVSSRAVSAFELKPRRGRSKHGIAHGSSTSRTRNTIQEDQLDIFHHPFNELHTVSHGDGLLYCTGNTALSWINFNYNKLSYISLEKILGVLEYQKKLNQHPRGLMRVSVDGNLLPTSCDVMTQIDHLTEAMFEKQRRSSFSKTSKEKKLY